MITAEEFVFEIDNKRDESKNRRLATVVALFDNKTAKIKFDGEDAASEKQYAYLESYRPTINDRVLLDGLGGTYVILGKVNYNVSPPSEEEVDRYLFDLKQVIMTKGLSITGGASITGATTLSSGATVVGNVGVNGNVNAVGLSATGALTGASLNVSGQVKGGSLFTSGTLSAGASDLDSLDVSGTSDLSNTNVSGIFLHKGNGLSFFNKGSSVARQSVSTLTGTVTADQVKDKLNDLINTLDLYGLIRKV